MALRLKIIIPLLAKSVANDWETVECLLARTLKSAFAVQQESKAEITISVVCHDIPHLRQTTSERIEFLQADHPIPSKDSPASKMEDKGLKLRFGVRKAAAEGADYAMFLDADDLLSKRLGFILVGLSCDAVCLERGWLWNGEGSVWLRRDFHKICGSSFVMKVNAHNFPNWLGNSAQRVCDQSHSNRLAALLNVGATVQKVKVPLCVYVTGTGQNWSGKSSVRMLRQIWNFSNWRPVTKKFRNEFSIA